MRTATNSARPPYCFSALLGLQIKLVPVSGCLAVDIFLKVLGMYVET